MSDVEANVYLYGHDEASQPMENAATRINKAWKSMRDEQRTIQREFELNNKTLVQTGRAISAVGNVVHRVTSLYNTWNLLQLRVQNANQNVSDSSANLAEVLNEFGPDSKQYQDALKRNKEALEEQQRAQRDTQIGYALMVTDIATSSGQIITNVIPKLKKLNSTLAAGGSRAGILGKALKGVGAVGGGALLGMGLLESEAISGTPLTDQEKLMNIGQQAAGGALLGATIGSVVPGIGTAIGAGAGAGIGAGVGIATNYGKQIMQFFTFNSPTSQELVKQVETAGKKASTFGP